MRASLSPFLLYMPLPGSIVCRLLALGTVAGVKIADVVGTPACSWLNGTAARLQLVKTRYVHYAQSVSD